MKYYSTSVHLYAHHPPHPQKEDPKMRALHQQTKHIFTFLLKNVCKHVVTYHRVFAYISPYPSLLYWFQMLARRILSPEMIHPDKEVGLEIEEGV